MREQISEEHRRTGALLEETRALLRGGDQEAMTQALTRLSQVLDAHFEQEDSLYHTAIAALQPEQRVALERLGDAHRDLRAHCAEVTRWLECGAVAESEREFETLAASFRRHEAEEESLLRSLDESREGQLLAHQTRPSER